jgi:hypothetical protein
MIGDVAITAANTPAGRAEALAVVRIDYPDPQTAVYHCRPSPPQVGSPVYLVPRRCPNCGGAMATADGREWCIGAGPNEATGCGYIVSRRTLTTPHTPPLRTGLHGDGI